MAAKTPPDSGADVRDASAARAYDFARPGKISPADRKWLGYLHADLAKRLEISLAGLVRDYVEITPAEPSETRWSGFVAALPSPCAVFMFAAPPLQGRSLLHLDPDLAFALVDRLFGGKGEPVNLERELTSIEQRIVGRFVDAVLAEVESVWRPAFELKISRTGFAPGPDLIEGGRVDEPVMEVGFELEAGALKGKFSLGYAHHMFEQAIRALAPVAEENGPQPSADGSAGMVNNLSLPVAARLSPTLVGMKHLVDLGVGDVLMLDNRVTEDVEVLIGHKPVMQGRPGSSSGRLAVKITRFIEQGG